MIYNTPIISEPMDELNETGQQFMSLPQPDISVLTMTLEESATPPRYLLQYATIIVGNLDVGSG